MRAGVINGVINVVVPKTFFKHNIKIYFNEMMNGDNRDTKIMTGF